jgi:peptidoglycan/LPS O-acetylase OafA/YrhL
MMPPIRRQRQHLWGVDAVRFTAALLVAFFHLTWQESSVADYAWFGWIGVQIFFVISGLVIAQSANNATPARFVESRVLRLYPAAWICALIGLGVVACIHHQVPDLGLRFVDSFLLSPVGPFLASAYWTLPVELAFYIMIFFLLLAGAFAQLELFAISMCIASVTYISIYAMQCSGRFNFPFLEFGYDWPNMTLLRHGIYFGAGMLIWLWSEQRISRAGWGALVLAVAAAPLEITCRTAELAPKLAAPLPLERVWPVPILVWLAALGVIIWSAKWEIHWRRPSRVWLVIARSAGLATYPLYLLHEEFGTAARNLFWKSGLTLTASVASSILATIILALVVSHLIEPVLRRIMRGLFYSIGSTTHNLPLLQCMFRSGGTLERHRLQQRNIDSVHK